jgi:hypothetical protein
MNYLKDYFYDSNLGVDTGAVSAEEKYNKRWIY